MTWLRKLWARWFCERHEDKFCTEIAIIDTTQADYSKGVVGVCIGYDVCPGYLRNGCPKRKSK